MKYCDAEAMFKSNEYNEFKVLLRSHCQKLNLATESILSEIQYDLNHVWFVQRKHTSYRVKYYREQLLKIKRDSNASPLALVKEIFNDCPNAMPVFSLKTKPEYKIFERTFETLARPEQILQISEFLFSIKGKGKFKKVMSIEILLFLSSFVDKISSSQHNKRYRGHRSELFQRLCDLLSLKIGPDESEDLYIELHKGLDMQDPLYEDFEQYCLIEGRKKGLALGIPKTRAAKIRFGKSLGIYKGKT